MITLQLEASIDIDPNRKIWISGTAQAEAEDTDLGQLAKEMCTAVTDEAMAAHEKLFPLPKEGEVPKSAKAATDAALRGESKEEDPLRTFVDD